MFRIQPSRHFLIDQAITKARQYWTKMPGMVTASAAPSASNAQVYSFPLLKPSEILACIRQMRIPVTEDEVRNCDPAAFRKILEVFIESQMGVARDQLNQLQFNGLSVLSYPALYDDAVPELAFFRHASRLLNAAGVYDFGMKDLLNPTPKRLRRILSALINFAKFRDERVAAFSEITRETEHLVQRKQTLQDENEALQRELQELLNQQAADEPEIQQVTEENAALTAEINTLNKKQAVLRHENAELKAKNQELKDELASFNYNILVAEKEIENLHSKIVTSPDRVKKEIHAIALSLEEAKDELIAMERRFRELQAFSQIVDRSERDILKTLDFMEEIEVEMKRCKDAKEQVKSQRQEIEENRQKMFEIISQRKRFEKLREQKRDQLERYRDESKLKKQAAERAHHNARDELQQLESKHSDVRQRINAHRDAAREIDRRKREDELQYQKQLYEMQEMFLRLKTAAQYYNLQLLDAIHADQP